MSRKKSVSKEEVNHSFCNFGIASALQIRRTSFSSSCNSSLCLNLFFCVVSEEGNGDLNVWKGDAGRAADSDCTHGCWAVPHPRTTPLLPWLESARFDRSCCFEISPLAFSSSPLITHSRNLMPPVKASEPSAQHHWPPPPLLTLSLTYMVKSPAAQVPCCKTILPL